ncbi:MAG: DUF3576 domain-containing protein [Pelagibacterales bacterium]|nr:DUF3576 domain-containing protein [Pelagibacterales bacterium]
MPSKFLKFYLIFPILIFLAQCGVFSETSDPLNQEMQLDQQWGEGIMRDSYENSMENKGTFMDLFKNESPSYKENIMWNVALDKISFMPLQSSDVQSGIITTEWFQTKSDLDNRMKLVIYIKSDVIEDSSVDVKVFKETFDGNKWNTSNQNSELGLKIKKSILDTSLELQIANQLS